LIATRKIFQPQAWTPAEALRFLRDVPVLEECGVLVRVPDWWTPKNPPRAKVSISVGARAPSGLGLDAMLDFDVRLTLGGETLSNEEWRRLVEGADGLTMIRGRWVEVDRERLQGVLEHWREAQRTASTEGLSFSAAMRLLVGAPGDFREVLAESEDDSARPQWSEVSAGPWLREALAGLRDPALLARADPGRALTATLRPYQVAGVKWLWHLYRLRLGGCLADDMGLGKTIQVLALLLLAKAARSEPRPSLLVVPASLVGNWCAEAARFAPSLRLLVVHPTLGSRSVLGAEAPEDLESVDLVLTSFGTVARVPWLAQTEWDLVALDEAQAIKNPATQQARAVKALRARRRLALTGTPVENRLQDLWSIFDFVNPGLLGSAKQFAEVARQAAGERPQPVFGMLRKLVAPYILRRLKTDKRIIDDLPEKTELDVICSLTPQQAALYARTVGSLEEELQRAQEGIQRRGLVLSYLMRFKQICNHPSQLTGDGLYAAGESGKLRRLRALVEEIASRGEKLLVFTQFQEISAMLVEFLAAIYGRPGVLLTGSTPVRQRKALVDAFQSEGGPPFFVLSLKAGGTGLNLTAASQVVHFDRWWNPAVESQATDRAFRIGQTKRVMVHKLICAGTIEERIDQMIKDKRRLASEILSGDGEIDLTSLSDSEILNLVALDLKRATAAGEEV
jgi:non-specific serine/threonine protein kinase